MAWFRRKEAAPVQTKSASFLLGMGQATFTSRNYLALAAEGYSLNPVVHACVTKIAAAVATADVFVYPVDQITGRSDVLHLKTVNPLDPWLGLAPMTAAAYGIDIFNAGQVWNKKLLDNDCRPSGALMVKAKDGSPASLTDDQYFRLKQNIDEQFTGAKNAGRPLLLENGLEWAEMSLTPTDMDFKENMLTAARFVAGVFGVPPQLVNIPGESTYSNYEQAEVSFWANTVLPLLGAVLDDFNRWLAPLYGDGVYLWYDEEMIPALEPLRNAKSTRINASGFMTINEKREAMGLEAVDGGDVVLVPSTNIPLDLAGAVDLPEPGSEADQEEQP